MDNTGQMMVLETIFFASTVILAIVFLYQLAPPSVVTEVYSTDLKAIGDDALRNIYQDNVTNPPDYAKPGYPQSALVHYLIENEYGSLVSDLHNLIPSTVMYNIYVTNVSTTMFWCNSFAGSDNSTDILQGVDPVSVAHCLIAIDPTFLEKSSSALLETFDGYSDCVYEVQLEMWYI